MSTPCAFSEEITLYLDGELSQNRARELEQHLAGCDSCSRQRQELLEMLAALAPSREELDDPRLCDDVLRRVRTGAPPAAAAAPWWRRWFMLPGAAALAAAAAVLLLVVAPFSGPRRTDRPGEFTARGSSRTEDERWLGLAVLRPATRGSGYEEVGGRIAPHDRLVFGYLDVRGKYHHLMIFAVDRGGRVFWYHPAFEKQGDDPSSVAIKPGRHELPIEIEHDLQAGPLRIFALFTGRPRRVSELERLVEGLRASHPDLTTLPRLPLEAGQVTRLLQVEAR